MGALCVCEADTLCVQPFGIKINKNLIADNLIIAIVPVIIKESHVVTQFKLNAFIFGIFCLVLYIGLIVAVWVEKIEDNEAFWLAIGVPIGAIAAGLSGFTSESPSNPLAQPLSEAMQAIKSFAGVKSDEDKE